MKKFEIVKEHKEFTDIINLHDGISNSYYSIYIRKNNYNYPRFGIAVGKKLGNAVNRNLLKRRMRMILTQNKKEFSKGYDYIIIMKGKCNTINYQQMEENLIALISKRSK